MKMIGDMRLLEVNEQLLTLKGTKVIDMDLSFVNGKISVKAELIKNRKSFKFNKLIDIDIVEEMTPKQFHNYLIEQ